MFQRKSSKPTPGSAEYASSKLTLSGHSCSHYPKLKPGIHAGVPSRLGFFSTKFDAKAAASAECNRISVLQTNRLCRACYDAAVPQGFDVWCISQHGPCPAVMSAVDGQDYRFSVLVESGTESFSTHGRRLQIIFNKPYLPAHVDAADAWIWFQKRRRPFYVDALHATSHADPTLVQRVNTDALVATRHGTIYNIANARKGNHNSATEQSKSSKRWSFTGKLSTTNIRASISSVSLVSTLTLTRKKPKLHSDSMPVRASVDSPNLRFEEYLKIRPPVPPVPAVPAMRPSLHKRPPNFKMHSQPHPSVYLPSSRPRAILPRSHSDVSWGGFASLDERLATMQAGSSTATRHSTKNSANEISHMLRSTRAKPEMRVSNRDREQKEAPSKSPSPNHGPHIPPRSPRRMSTTSNDDSFNPRMQSLHLSAASDSSSSDSGNSTPSTEPTLVEYPSTSNKLPVVVLHGAKADTAVPMGTNPDHLIPSPSIDVPKDVTMIHTQSIPGAWVK